MVTLKKYQNKKIAIYGMGLTGRSAAKILRKSKSKILCWDDSEKTRKKLINGWLKTVNSYFCLYLLTSINSLKIF